MAFGFRVIPNACCVEIAELLRMVIPRLSLPTRPAGTLDTECRSLRDQASDHRQCSPAAHAKSALASAACCRGRCAELLTQPRSCLPDAGSIASVLLQCSPRVAHDLRADNRAR